MKKLFGALIAGSLMFGAVMASAATLPVSGGSLQANTMSVVCQPSNPVHVGYTTQISGSNVNEVKTVTLSGIDAACAGANATVNIKTDSPGTVWYGWGTVPAGGGSMTFDLTDATFSNAGLPPVASVQYVDVMIAAK